MEVRAGEPVIDVILPDGHGVPVHPGDVIICRNGLPIDVLSTVRFRERYQPAEEGLRVPTTFLGELEERLGLGATLNPQALLEGVRRLARLEIGRVAVDFTPSQWEEIKVRGEKNGMTPEQEVERTVKFFIDDLFWKG